MTKELLVTGGAGFIGSNFIQYVLDHTSYRVTNIDALTYAGNLKNIKGFAQNENYRFISGDIRNRDELNQVFDRTYDTIVNFAAESHVDRSIENSYLFLDTNITGSLNLLYCLLEGGAQKMLQVSTDEVYGSLSAGDLPFTEYSPLQPNNPYAASKASADLFARSFSKTFQLPVIITRCSNNYGPYQHVEKFIPKVISNALQNKSIPLYGDGKQVRDWLFVEDHCRALLLILEYGQPGQVYNIGGGHERTNKEVVKLILDYLNQDHRLIAHVEDRKGHDRRYAINWEKLHRELGWRPQTAFHDGLVQTIEWYKKIDEVNTK